MFPVSLLLEGRSCLLVGGGRVAARKGKKLAEAGAVLTVVAPEIRDAVRAVPGVQLVERPFEESDLDGVFLVFALTNDAILNHRIVGLCRDKGILCSVADANWPDGDLILPASLEADGLTVAIGTAGRACRRSRMLRESLSRHIRFLSDVDLVIFGADCTDGFQTLENLKARRVEIETILSCLQGVHEFIILDTCNRFEVVGLVSSGIDLSLFLKDIPQQVRGLDAFIRFAETAAGLYAQALGENRIVAQIKDALSLAQEQQRAGSFMQSWVDITLCISKEIRQKTAPLLPALETEDLVFQWLEANFPNLGKTLIVGRGELGNGLAGKFAQAVQISGRSDFELRKQLPGADLVICATGSETFVIDEPHRPLLRDGAVLIDVSMPRNINPALPGVVGLGDLRASVRQENIDAVFAESRAVIARYAGEYERLIQFKRKDADE
jgi:siroheme synthase-like protein